MGTCGASLHGPFSRTRFLGATVVSNSLKLGWGESRSELNVELVEDNCDGAAVSYVNGVPVVTGGSDFFNPPKLGSPVFYAFGTFQFAGILQNWERNADVRNGRRYTCVVTDPREILEGCQIITNHYNGGVFGVPNLINAFGAAEEFGAPCPVPGSLPLTYSPASGFGGAQVNDAGMTWNQIRSLLPNLLNNPFSKYSGGLRLRDTTYFIDISEVPFLDQYYRIEGDSANLLELITNVTQAAGADYYVELIWPNFIKVQVSSRRSQGSSAFAVDSTGNLGASSILNFGDTGSERNNAGIELRHEVTNAFMVGDLRKDLWQISYSGDGDTYSDTIWPYWGKDDQGFPRISQKWDLENNFNVNIGKLRIPGIKNANYNITVLEILAAQDSFESWLAFMGAKKPNLIPNLGNAIDVGKGFNAIVKGEPLPKDVIALAKNDAKNAHKQGIEPDAHDGVRRLYDFVKRMADEFLGKKFLVGLPLVCCAADQQEPLKLKLNWQRADSAWSDFAVLGLGQNSPALSFFRNEDGQIQCFVRIAATKPLDMESVPPDDYIQKNQGVAYVRATFEEITFLDPINCNHPRAIVTLQQPIYVKPEEQDKVPLHAALLHAFATEAKDSETAKKLLDKFGADNTLIGTQRLPILPRAAAIPLQSTNLSYGPWYGSNFGISAKTNYQRNTSFNPWTFGSTGIMNFAGAVSVVNQITNQIVVESGSITYPGLPTVNAGQALVAGGPEVTNIDLQASTSGVKTSLRMRTFTPNYAEVGRQRIRALMELGQKSRKVQTAFLKAFVAPNNREVQNNFVKLLTRSDRFNRSSSHWFMAAEAVQGKVSSSGGSESESESESESTSQIRTMVSTGELKKFLPEMAAGSDSQWKSKSGVELSGLYRPFGTKPSSSATTYEDIKQDTAKKEIGFSESESSGKMHTKHYKTPPPRPPVKSEQFIPINVNTLNPYLNEGKTKNGLSLGTSDGHDIEYVIRDGFYPTHLSVMRGGYSTDNDYRAMALRGPIIMAGWGYDVKGKPVPNKSSSYPDKAQLEFSEDWLRRPDKWKCGPIDLRWDETRGVWTSPQPYKLVLVSLCENLQPFKSAKAAILFEPADALNADGSEVSEEDCCSGVSSSKSKQIIEVHSVSGRPVPKGWGGIAYYDETRSIYRLISHDDPLLRCRVTNTIQAGQSGRATVLEVGMEFGNACNLEGTTITVINHMKHPICAGKQCYVYVRRITDYRAEGWIIQAEYSRLCVITSLEVIEVFDGNNPSGPAAGDNFLVDEVICCDRQIYLDAAWSVQNCGFAQPPGVSNTSSGYGYGAKGATCNLYSRSLDCSGSGVAGSQSTGGGTTGGSSGGGLLGTVQNIAQQFGPLFMPSLFI